MDWRSPRSLVFKKAKDYHKPGNPEVPNGLGVIYVLGSSAYLFLLYFFDVNSDEALTLAACILFGGFMGLFDDWVDLRWRYKALTPLIASLPLIAMRKGDTVMATYLFGKVDFGIYFYLVIAPLIVTVTTNTINQLGGLNGLETVCPSIVMAGLMVVSQKRVLLIVPLAILLLLAYFNYRGKLFVGNVGSFSVGITLASFTILSNIEQTLVIAISPYIINSLLILGNILLFRRRAELILKGNRLTSNSIRSLQTLIAYKRELTEHQIVLICSLIVGLTTFLAVMVWNAT
ncbi:hypothetical protein DRO28_01940 [Candidatus Bathyarchaeota archaeon]|nr:MAG: hypothetical protein DRO28_01940 [Candidatus Bathyarchaeota archaeon]